MTWCLPLLGSVASQFKGWSPLACEQNPWSQQSHNAMGHKRIAARLSAIPHPCLGLCCYSRSTVRIGTRWDTRTALASSNFQRTKKLTATTLRFANNTHKEVQPRAKFMSVGLAGEKSLRSEKAIRTAPPRMHCCQPYRPSRSRRVLSTTGNLIWVVYNCCGSKRGDSKSIETCGARERQSQHAFGNMPQKCSNKKIQTNS